MFRSLRLAVYVAALLPALSQAQVGKDSDLWDWTKSARHHRAIVKVSMVDDAGIVKASATGVIVRLKTREGLLPGEAHCLTAAHVIEDIEVELPPDQKSDKPSDDGKSADFGQAKKKSRKGILHTTITVHYRNGQRSRKCKVLSIDEERDLAMLLVALPSDIKPARLARRAVKRGDRLEFAGLGGGTDVRRPRHFRADASNPTNETLIFADATLLPGDSGGPVFNSDHEVVGIISGGWIWWDGGVKNKTGQKVIATWPARACNYKPIRDMVLGQQRAASGSSSPIIKINRDP